VLSADAAAFDKRGSGRWGGNPSDVSEFRTLIHIQAAAVMQHGSFVEDAWECEEEDEWMGRKSREHCARLEWSSVLCTQRY
jgi:hypothetical protein